MRLSGLTGNDTLVGNASNDTLNGGVGSYRFLFAAAGTANSKDTVQDIVHSIDQLGFSIADYSSAPGFTATFIWHATAHTLYWDDDGTGSHSAIAIATFTESVTITASDLHFE